MMLVTCLGGLGFGLLSGFLKVVVPFVLLLVVVGLAGAASGAIGPSLPGALGGEHSQIAIAFLVVFVALQVMSMMVSFFVGVAMTAATAAVSVMPMGALLNRAGGALAGLFHGCILLSVLLIALQQIPVGSISVAIEESSFAHRPIDWVDKLAPSIELSPDWVRQD